MTALVISTIVVYFLFLPKVAPKIITLAVLPFAGSVDIPADLKREFPRHLSDLLSESRDVVVVDYEHSLDTPAVSDPGFRGFMTELGATHIIDGNYEVGDDLNSFSLFVRLVDVSKVAPKLRWNDAYEWPEISLTDIREIVVTSIREHLYDTSVPATLATRPQMDEVESVDHPQIFNLQIKVPPKIYDSELQQIQVHYDETQDFLKYVDRSTSLASQYPNSLAVSQLASLYHELGWFKQEEDLLYRHAKVFPRSAEPAIRIAIARYMQGDIDGVNQALEIARNRDPESNYYQQLYDWIVHEQPLESSASEYFNQISNTSLPNSNSFVKNGLKTSNSTSMTTWDLCDQRIEIAFYTGDIDDVFENLSCSTRLWLQPPAWWNNNNEIWQRFITERRYTQWLESKGINETVLAQLEPVSVRELLTSRRRVVRDD